ncbi:hypothetical protein MNBD_PLANCTO02-2223, partial [hydrothermal vent metagenome]
HPPPTNKAFEKPAGIAETPSAAVVCRAAIFCGYFYVELADDLQNVYS